MQQECHHKDCIVSIDHCDDIFAHRGKEYLIKSVKTAFLKYNENNQVNSGCLNNLGH